MPAHRLQLGRRIERSLSRGSIIDWCFYFVVGLWVPILQSATFDVTNTADSGTGSLREAILDANGRGGDTIAFSNVTGTITLSSALPPIAGNTTLLGPGRSLLTVSGSNLFRVFAFNSGTTSLVAGLTVANGCVTNDSGAGIYNLGMLTVVDCALIGNRSFGGRGGGIYSSGNLRMLDSSVFNNLAIGADGATYYPGTNALGGGAYFIAGNTLISNCVFTGNVAAGGRGYGGAAPGGAGRGGGVCIDGSLLIIVNATFSNNAATGGQGGGSGFGYGGGQGGGGTGGGIFLSGGTLIVTNATFARNVSLGGGGGYGYTGGGNGGAASGAAIALNNGGLIITGSTLNENVVLAGLGGGSSDVLGAVPGYGGDACGGSIYAETNTNVSIVNCTLSANEAMGGDVGGRGIGGGIWANTASFDVINSTVANNVAVGGKLATGIGGGIYSSTNAFRIWNTIIAGNRGTTNLNGTDVIMTSDAYGAFSSQGHNLIGNTNGASGFTARDGLKVAVALGPLQDNGGPTLTHAVLFGSPAMEAGSSVGAPAFDQRGVFRPQGSAVDIGAFERVTHQPSRPPMISVSSPDRAVLVGSSVSLSALVSGTPPFSFQWEKNGVPIGGATNTTLDLLNVQPSDAGSYQITLSASEGIATSEEIILEVKPSFIDPSFEWVRASSGDSFQYVSGITVDPDGNVFVAGSFGGRIQFGTTALTNYVDQSDIYVLKYDRGGSLLWAQHAGGNSYDSVNAIASDAFGNLYLTGGFQQTTTLGSLSVSGAGGIDVFVAKLAPNGNSVWLRQAGGSAEDTGRGIAIDTFGNCIVVGSFWTNASFGNLILHSSGNADVFVAKYNNQGVVQWARQAGGTDFDYGEHVAVDEMGNCYVTGNFTGTAVFDPGVTLSSTNQNTPFIASYDSGGILRWVKQPIQFQDRAFLHAVAANPEGQFYVAGGFSGEMVIGTNAFTGAGGYNTLVAKYDSNGTLSWVRSIGRIGSGVWSGVVVDRDGSCYLTGNFYGNVGTIVATPNLGATLTSFGSADVIVEKLGVDGRLRWVTSGGGKDWDSGAGIAVNSSGEVFVSGYFSQHASFGPYIIYGSPSYENIFLAKLAIHPRLEFRPPAAVRADQPAQFSLEGEAGVSYVIQTSENLSNWSPLFTMTNIAGRSEITDSFSTNFNRRFYRASLLP